jgi:hypothetical protein
MDGAYRWDTTKASYVAEALEVLTLEGAQVKQMTAFMVPELFRSFGLPDQLPASWRRRRASVPEPAPPKADGGSGSAT